MSLKTVAVGVCAVFVLAAAGCGGSEGSSGNASGGSGRASTAKQTKKVSVSQGKPSTACPSASEVSRFVPFVEAEDRPSDGEGAETQPEVTLSCLYSGPTNELLSFYIADFGGGAQQRFDKLSAALRSPAKDAEPFDQEFDKVISEDDATVLVDINYVGDSAQDDTQWVSGVTGVVRNGDAICAVPLFGMAANTDVVGGAQALEDNADGVLKLLRSVCGAG